MPQHKAHLPSKQAHLPSTMPISWGHLLGHTADYKGPLFWGRAFILVQFSSKFASEKGPFFGLGALFQVQIKLIICQQNRRFRHTNTARKIDNNTSHQPRGQALLLGNCYGICYNNRCFLICFCESFWSSICLSAGISVALFSGFKFRSICLENYLFGEQYASVGISQQHNRASRTNKTLTLSSTRGLTVAPPRLTRGH